MGLTEVEKLQQAKQVFKTCV